MGSRDVWFVVGSCKCGKLRESWAGMHSCYGGEVMKGIKQQQWTQQSNNTLTEMLEADTRETNTNQRLRRKIIKP